jgi:hypothetical protein
MATAAPYYRVPVVIFAVLVGGLYVYAKSGGALFGSRTQVTPATNTHGEELAPPQIEFMMGPKSAPAFDELPPAPPPAPPVASYGTPMSRPVLGGSKSRAVVEPSDVAPSANVAPPTNAAPLQRRMLPGSKAAILVDPATLTPAPQPVPPTNNIPPNYSPPTNIGPSNLGPSNANPRNASPSNTAPRALPGSKSMILVDPASLVPVQQAAQPQQQLQLPAQPRNAR